MNTDHLILLPLSLREWSFPGKAGIWRWINLGDGTSLAEFTLQILPGTQLKPNSRAKREGYAAGPRPCLHTEQH